MNLSNSLPDYDLRQLRIFHILSNVKSYTETARRVFRTQSAVSHAIKKLESSVGTKLVEGAGNSFSLTEEGKRLLEACDSVFFVLDNASESIARSSGRSMGRIRLGTTVEFGCSVLMKHMGGFLEQNPDVQMEFHMSQDLLKPLLADELDIIIDCAEHNLPDLEARPLFRESYAVVSSPEYRERFSVYSLESLRECAILSLDAEATWWNRFLMTIPAMKRPSLARIIRISHIRAIIVAAMSGMGVALVPTYSVLHELEEGSLVNLFPGIGILEDRFSIYQKSSRAGLERHSRLTEYLRNIKPLELGQTPSRRKHGLRRSTKY